MAFLKALYTKLTASAFAWPLKIAVTAAVVFLVNKTVSKAYVPELARHCSLLLITASFLAGCAGYFLQVLRWKIILRWSSISIRFPDALRTMLWGSLLAFITPGRTGEFFRGLSLPSAKKDATLWCVAADKVFAGGAVLVFGVLGCIVVHAKKEPYAWGHWAIVIAAGLALIATCIALPLKGGRALKALKSRFVAVSKLSLYSVILLSAVAHALLLTQTALLFSMFGVNGAMNAALAGSLAYALMLLFPFFIANMGIREYSFGMFLGQVTLSRGLTAPAVALGASMGILAINILAPAIAGLVWWLIPKMARCDRMQ